MFRAKALVKSKLRHHRESDDLNQADLAAAVGVSRQTINAIERKRYEPSIELAFKLTNYFDYQIKDLFDPELNGTEQ